MGKGTRDIGSEAVGVVKKLEYTDRRPTDLDMSKLDVSIFDPSGDPLHRTEDGVVNDTLISRQCSDT